MNQTNRILIAATAHHIVRKTQGGMQVFRDGQDYRHCIHHIRELRETNSVAVHAWCLLPDRIHLLATAERQAADISDFMKSLSCRVTMRYKRRHMGAGSPWEPRFRSSPVQPGQWLLACMNYIERLPVLHGFVKTAFHYHHSSYRMRLGKTHIYWLDDAEDYKRLGHDAEARAEVYRDYFNAGLCASDRENIERAVNTGQVTGCAYFEREIRGK